MSHLLARIMLALFIVPLAALVYLISFMLLYDGWLRRDDEKAFVVSGLLTGVFAAAYWIALWFRSVRWTRARVVLTVVAGGIAAAIGAVVGVLMAWIDDTFGAFIWAPVGIFLWLPCTVFIWRETGSERASRIEGRDLRVLVCPRCGYNLTGLASTTCPECGTAYTIDQLLAEQPGRVGESEQEMSAACPAASP